jgi:hypothetical protein
MQPVILTRQKLFEFLHLFVLVSFALAQPLYDLLGRYADFFVAHGTGPLSIFCLIGVVSILFPVLLVLIETGAGLFFDDRVCRFLHLGFIGILAGLIVMPPLNRWGILPDAAVYCAAVLSGGAFILAYARWKFMRSFLTALSPAILIFPAYFLFFTPVRSIVFQKKSNLVSDVSIHHKVPVILLVFDEFNTMALLNKDGVVDSVRYPNFASFGGESWWFPNAISSSLETMKSIPAILTGVKPSLTRKELATFTDHPDNLFSLLAGQYYLNVQETETAMYPDTIRNHVRVFEPANFFSDISMLCRVLLIPGVMKNSSAYLDGRWKDFSSTNPGNETRVSRGVLYRKKQIEEFISGIRAGKRNQLNFIHLELPHVPYEYLSSGKSYNNAAIFPEGIVSEEAGWGSSVDLAEVAYQRYLQQVGYTDKVLGSILDGVKEKGIYDESLIIVTADHGVSMLPGKTRRDYTSGNRYEVLKVPFLVKLPDQKKSEICNDLVSGVDILPTIAGVLGVKLPWDHDGASVIPGFEGERQTIRPDKVLVPEIGVFRLKDLEGFPLLGWKTSRFGSGTPLTELVRRDTNRTLLEKDIKDLDVRAGNHPLKIEIENIDQFKNIELGSGYLPALLRGHVTNFTSQGKLALAFAVNGKIQATTTTSQWGKENAFFTALLPESAFRQGRNEVAVFMINGRMKGVDPYLVPVPLANPVSFTLRSGKAGEEALVTGEGREFPVKPYVAEGFLDSFYLNEYTVLITGWAFDDKAVQPVQSVVLFSGNQFLALAKPGVERKDIIPYLKTEKARFSGFQFEMPFYTFTGKIRAFGITRKGIAYEFIITDSARKTMEKIFGRKF